MRFEEKPAGIVSTHRIVLVRRVEYSAFLSPISAMARAARDVMCSVVPYEARRIRESIVPLGLLK